MESLTKKIQLLKFMKVKELINIVSDKNEEFKQKITNGFLDADAGTIFGYFIVLVILYIFIKIRFK